MKKGYPQAALNQRVLRRFVYRLIVVVVFLNYEVFGQDTDLFE